MSPFLDLLKARVAVGEGCGGINGVFGSGKRDAAVGGESVGSAIGGNLRRAASACAMDSYEHRMGSHVVFAISCI